MQMMLDYLSVGIDPEESTIFLQSAVRETYELNLIFEMLVTVPRLERVPSVKEMAQAANLERMPFGLLGYPILQAADILLPRSNLVPVGKDNEAQVEVSREIARRFNNLYGEVFAHVSQTRKLGPFQTPTVLGFIHCPPRTAQT